MDERVFGFGIHPLNIEDLINNQGMLQGVVVSTLYKAPFLYDRVVIPRLKKLYFEKSWEITGIKSHTGQSLRGVFTGIPYTTKQLLNLAGDGKRQVVVDATENARRVAQEAGAQNFGLGAFLSILTKRGRSLNEGGIPVTTGSSYTAISAIEGIYYGAKRLGLDVEKESAAVFGVGSVGSLCAYLLAKRGLHIVLVGQEGSEDRLEEMKDSITHYLEERGGGVPTIDCSTKKDAVRGCKIVVTATNISGYLFETREDFEMFEPGTIVGDVARPHDIPRDIYRYRKDVLVLDAGVIKVPGNPYFELDFGFPKGTAYACMSETMMLALENVNESWTESSNLSLDARISRIELMQKAAKKHGFEIAQLRSFLRPLEDGYIEAVRSNKR